MTIVLTYIFNIEKFRLKAASSIDYFFPGGTRYNFWQVAVAPLPSFACTALNHFLEIEVSEISEQR